MNVNIAHTNTVLPNAVLLFRHLRCVGVGCLGALRHGRHFCKCGVLVYLSPLAASSDVGDIVRSEKPIKFDLEVRPREGKVKLDLLISS